MTEPTKEQIEIERLRKLNDEQRLSDAKTYTEMIKHKEAEVERLRADLELRREHYATELALRRQAEARLAKVVDERHQLQHVLYQIAEGHYAGASHIAQQALEILAAAQPEEGPCSACGDGDTAQEFHKHAAAQPEEEHRG